MPQAQPERDVVHQVPPGINQSEDRELVAAVLRKDRKATAEFVARCADPVYGYVWRRLMPRSDLVEDLVQEVFLAAWQNLEKFRGDSSIRSWILGIARHKVEDHYRDRIREQQFPEDDENQPIEPVSSEDVETIVSDRQAGERARQIVASLPETYGIILLWKYWENRSLREIAEQTGRTEKAIERLLARARHQFKQRWNERPSTGR